MQAGGRGELITAVWSSIPVTWDFSLYCQLSISEHPEGTGHIHLKQFTVHDIRTLNRWTQWWHLPSMQQNQADGYPLLRYHTLIHEYSRFYQRSGIWIWLPVQGCQFDGQNDDRNEENQAPANACPEAVLRDKNRYCKCTQNTDTNIV
jgi:hypothetical protein